MQQIESCKSYPDYLKKSFKATPFGEKFTKASKYLRRSFAVTRALLFVFRMIWLVLSYIQTGAFFLISFSVLIVLLPALVIFLLILILTSFFKFRKANEFFAELLNGKRVSVFFVNDETTDIPESDGDCVIVVHSHRLFVRKRESNRVCHIGMPYFFSLKKKVLPKSDVTYTDLREKDTETGPPPQ